MKVGPHDEQTEISQTKKSLKTHKAHPARTNAGGEKLEEKLRKRHDNDTDVKPLRKIGY